MPLSDKQRSERIGKALMRSAETDTSAADQVAERAELFEGVLRKLKETELSSKKPHFSTRYLNWRMLMPAGSIALVLVAVTSAVLVKQQTSVKTVGNIVAKKPIVDGPSAPIRVVPSQPDSDGGKLDSPFVPVNDSSQARAPRVRERIPIRPPANIDKRSPMPENAETVDGGEFYPLTYAGDPYETARGGRVVRVDMPRASLFAMGINVPLENETVSVKADLLIGPDGVARGFRLVR